VFLTRLVFFLQLPFSHVYYFLSSEMMERGFTVICRCNLYLLKNMSVKLLSLDTLLVCWMMAAYKTALHINSLQVVFCCLLKFWSFILMSLPIYLSPFTHMQYECFIISFPNQDLNIVVGIMTDKLCWKFQEPLFIFIERLERDCWCRNVASLQCCPKIYEGFKCVVNSVGPNNRSSWCAEWCWECQVLVTGHSWTALW
jgi:hypothetical protein